jgi:hypothetical protein
VEIGLVDFHGWWVEWETALSISTRSIVGISTSASVAALIYAAASEL